MKTNILVLLGIVVWLTSCSDRRLIKYNETKIFPITAEISESNKYIGGILHTSDLKKLFDIPSDGDVEKLVINGMNLVVERQNSSEADLISYSLFVKKDNQLAFDTLLNRKNRDVSFIGVKSFNVSSELDSKVLGSTKEHLDFLVKLPSSNIIFDLTYGFLINATDFAGQPKKFVGKVTGQLSIQVVYSVCESFPKGLFSEYPKCQ